MYLNSHLTRIFVFTLFTFFTQNFTYAQFTECPPEADASSNSTSLTIDSGVSFIPGNFPSYLASCTAAVDNADDEIVVTFQGSPTTFEKQSGLSQSSNNTCEVSYNAAGSNLLISPPYTIDFPQIMSPCFYAQGGILPVEISKFEVNVTDKGVLIEWETLEEWNNDYFEIYQSNDTEKWEAIGTISGAGTTRQTVNYEFIDENPAIGENYYALTQVDYDGTKQMSRIKLITLKDTNNRLKLYPNPASDNLTVEVWEDADFPLDVNIFDTTGKLIAIRQLTDYSQSLNIEELGKGFYYLQVNTERESFSQRFIKQ